MKTATRTPRIATASEDAETPMNPPVSRVRAGPLRLRGAIEDRFIASGRESNRRFTASRYCALILGVLWCCCSPASAGTVYSAAADFSIASNPNGVWSYGYSPATSGPFTPVVLYAYADTTAWNNPLLHRWAGEPGWGSRDEAYPWLAKHIGTVPLPFGSFIIPPGALMFSPGANSEVSIVSWTAPGSGAVSVSVRFTGFSDDYGTTDVHVYRNNSALYDGMVTLPGEANSRSYNATGVAVSVGDTIRMIVGAGGNGYISDQTYLDAIIDFTLASYGISGYVRTPGGSGISSVTVSGLPGNPTTDASGYYSTTVSYGWSGTATPSQTGYTFSPNSRSYSSVTANQSSQDYTGTPITYTVSGYVRTSGGSGISNVTMSGLPGGPATDTNGYYTAMVSYGWSGTATPSKTGYTFSPLSRSYANVTNDQSGEDYTAVTNSAPRLAIRSSEVEVCWTSATNVAYRVEYRSTLTSNTWLTLRECVASGGIETCIFDKVSRGEPQRFYRVAATNCAPEP